MSDVIRANFTSGQNIYLIARYAASGYVILCDGTQTVYNADNITDYDFPLIEKNSTGLYYLNVPSNWPNGLIDIQFYIRSGATPAVTDQLAFTATLIKNPDGQEFDIIRGDDYIDAATQDNRIYFQVINGPDLTDSTGILTIYNASEEVLFTKAVDIISDTTLAVPFTNLETTALTSGTYEAEIVFTLSDLTTQSLWNGNVNVLEQSEVNIENIPTIDLTLSGMDVVNDGNVSFVAGDDVLIHFNIVSGPDLTDSTGTVYLYNSSGVVAYSYPMAVVSNSDVTLTLTSLQTSTIVVSSYRASVKFILSDNTIRSIWSGTIDITDV